MKERSPKVIQISLELLAALVSFLSFQSEYCPLEYYLLELLSILVDFLASDRAECFCLPIRRRSAEIEGSRSRKNALRNLRFKIWGLFLRRSSIGSMVR